MYVTFLHKYATSCSQSKAPRSNRSSASAHLRSARAAGSLVLTNARYAYDGVFAASLIVVFILGQKPNFQNKFQSSACTTLLFPVTHPFLHHVFCLSRLFCQVGFR